MRRSRAVHPLLIAAALLVRRSDPQPAVVPRCPDQRWKAATSRDSSLVFCVPPDYRRVKRGNLLTRVHDSEDPPFAGDDWISVVQVSDSEVHAQVTPWPPSLLRDPSWPCADCIDATDYAVHWDSVADRIVQVETARVTGGFAGWKYVPTIRAAWPTPEGDWVFVQGQGHSMATLDELRQILRTVRVRRRTSDVR